MYKRYYMRFKKWTMYAAGKSYQHHPQGIGAYFRPTELAGYFNDLRHKADWTGLLSDDGVPLVNTDTMPAFAFPIVIFQWGLGNWDCALGAPNDLKYRDCVLRAANWALKNQTEVGGWICWSGLKRPTISDYSAMAQGQAISLLVRCARAFPDQAKEFTAAAERAAWFMCNSGQHALTSIVNGRVCLQEYPGDALCGVLNGWVFALMGLYDLDLAQGHKKASERTLKLADDLAGSLNLYDNGYWSLYDLTGSVASPFYHELHVSQLLALGKVFRNIPAFYDVAKRFDQYGRRTSNRLRSIAQKVVQKLNQPSVGEML